MEEKEKSVKQQIEEELKAFSPKDREKFEKDFNSDPDIIKLQRQYTIYQQSYQIVSAIKIQQKIDRIKLTVLRSYKAQMETKVERMNLLNLKIPREKLERIVDNLVGIHMLCDVLENFSNEIEYILQENAPDWHVESFNNILKLGEQASEQIEWIAENTDLMEYDSWGNECDNFTDMFRNKAHKLLKDAAERRVRNKEKEEEETNNDN